MGLRPHDADSVDVIMLIGGFETSEILPLFDHRMLASVEIDPNMKD